MFKVEMVAPLVDVMSGRSRPTRSRDPACRCHVVCLVEVIQSRNGSPACGFHVW